MATGSGLNPKSGKIVCCFHIYVYTSMTWFLNLSTFMFFAQLEQVSKVVREQVCFFFQIDLIK